MGIFLFSQAVLAADCPAPASCKDTCDSATDFALAGKGDMGCSSSQLCCSPKIATTQTVASCMGTCVTPAECVMGRWPVSNPDGSNGTCPADIYGANKVCCGALATVTPSGGNASTPAAPTTPVAPVSTAGDVCPTGFQGLTFPCPLGQGATIPSIAARMIAWALGLIGALFFAMFIYGGVQFIMAGGDSKSIGAGMKTLTNAVIGLAIIMLSYVLLNFVLQAISKALAGGG